MFGNNPRLYLVLAWSLVLSIIILSILPGSSIPKFDLLNFLAIDKIGHLMFYGMAAWSFLKYFSLKYQSVPLLKIGVLLFLLGVLLELLQYSMHQGRSFDLLDVLTNGLGVYCGLNYFEKIIAHILGILIRKKNQ
jgi:hypothetical protein